MFSKLPFQLVFKSGVGSALKADHLSKTAACFSARPIEKITCQALRTLVLSFKAGTGRLHRLPEPEIGDAAATTNATNLAKSWSHL